MSVGYNSRIVTDGLVLCLDAANPKSYSPNVHPNPTDIYAWVNNGTGNNCTLSRDNISSPVGYTPLKMVQTGSGAYTHTYTGSTIWGICPATNGQTWTVSAWTKASSTKTIRGCWVSYLDSNGNYLSGSGWSWPTIGTEWTRISSSGTINNVSVAYVGVRLDGNDDGSGTIWWDGLQLERSSTATTFNQKTNTNGVNWWDLSGYDNNASLNGTVPFGVNSLTFDGTAGNYYSKSTLSIPTANNNRTILCWTYPDSTGPSNGYTGLVAFGGRASTTPSDSILLSLQTLTSTWYVGSAYWSNDYNPANLPINKDAWNMVGISANSLGIQNNTKLICGNSSGLNSVIGSSSMYSKGLAVTNNYLTVGCTDNGGGRPMKGKIAVVLVYNRELSNDEITQNFNAFRGRFGI